MMKLTRFTSFNDLKSDAKSHQANKGKNSADEAELKEFIEVLKANLVKPNNAVEKEGRTD